LRIVEDHKAIDEYGVTSPRDLARARAKIAAGHAAPAGFDYTTLQGLKAVNDVVFDDKIGIGRVWGDAMSIAVLLRFARSQPQNLDNAAPWEKAFLMRGQDTFSLE
jgi:hypothetical protein